MRVSEWSDDGVTRVSQVGRRDQQLRLGCRPRVGVGIGHRDGEHSHQGEHEDSLERCHFECFSISWRVNSEDDAYWFCLYSRESADAERDPDLPKMKTSHNVHQFVVVLLFDSNLIQFPLNWWKRTRTTISHGDWPSGIAEILMKGNLFVAVSFNDVFKNFFPFRLHPEYGLFMRFNTSWKIIRCR